MNVPFSFVLLFFTFSAKLNTCMAFIDSGITYLGFIQSVYDLQKRLKESEEKAFTHDIGDTLSTLQNLQNHFESDMRIIKESLKNNRDITDHVLKTNVLETNFGDLRGVLEDVASVRYGNNSIVDASEIAYWTVNRATARKAFNAIRRMIVKGDSLNAVSSNFHSNLEKFEDVCKTGLSHQQLLNILLSDLKMATVMYYLTSALIYDISKDPNGEAKKERLLKIVRNNYRNDVRRFLPRMASATTDFFKCDPDKHVDGSTYVQLRAFSRYFPDVPLPRIEHNCGHVCATNPSSGCEKYESCERGCPGRLVNCDNAYLFNPYEQGLFSICQSFNTSAIVRYKSIYIGNDVPKYFHCDNGFGYFTRAVITKLYNKNDYMPCAVCNCICEEDTFYIGSQVSLADHNDDRVMTGARFQLINNTLYIQIQDGKLHGNGTIDTDTLRWVPLENAEEKMKTRISWNAIRSVVLGEQKRTNGDILMGLGLHYGGGDSIQLYARYSRFEFRSGFIWPPSSIDYVFGLPDNSKGKIIECNDCEPSINAREENKMIYENNTAVRFTTTSLGKDGGQHTIPFIDIQDVTTKLPMPLIGAQIFLRGQEGYGGFLALRLFTYDISKYINDDLY